MVGPKNTDPHDTDTEQTPGPAPEQVCGPVRHGMLIFGWINVGLGVLGMVLPVMPTTVFLLIALWAFSKSSLRFHRWLYSHPRLGRTLRAWHTHRVIPLKAKLLAVGTMSASLTYVSVVVAEDWMLPVALAALLGGLALWIVTRPSQAPAQTLMLRQTQHEGKF